MSTVLYEEEGSVATLTLNRPDRLNAWTPSLESELYAGLDRALESSQVRAVVITGAGRGFCAGGDMEELGEIVSAGGEWQRQERHFEYVCEFPKPTLAAINGACAGIGLALALCCDLRFAADQAKITTSFTRRGLVSEHGTAWLLPRIVGRSRALDLLLSGRIVLGQEALAMGLVDRVYRPEEVADAARNYAQDLGENCSPRAMALSKILIEQADRQAYPEARELADRLTLESHGHPDAEEGWRSLVEKRAPRFEPLFDPPAID